MTLTEQLDALRDGDVARAEWPAESRVMSACEGVVETKGERYIGGVQITYEGQPVTGLTSVTALRPVLREGDRVRCKRFERQPVGTVVATYGTEVRVRWGDGETLIIGGCSDLHRPDELERLPAEPEPTIAVGQWWRHWDGAPMVVVEKPDDEHDWLLRRWDSVDCEQWDGDDIAGMTLIDGPPEPPIGAVVALEWSPPGSPCIAIRRKDNYYWAVAGRKHPHLWSQILKGCDATTLRVLAVLEGE